MSEQATNALPQEKKSWFYGLVRFLARILFSVFFPVRFHDAQRLQREGAALLISNHLSYLDPPLLALAIRHREVTFLAKKELGNNPIGAWVMKKLHPILVDRKNSDMAAMRACLAALAQGRILGIFPEGTRRKEGLMEQIEQGMPLIALRSGAPIVPVLISRKPKLFRLTHCYVGQDIPSEDLIQQGVNSDTCRLLMERMHAVYREMMEVHKNSGRK